MEFFPALNACLNSASALLVACGYLAIRRRRVNVHISCMVSALLVSMAFLASYLYYHFAIKGGQPTRFPSVAPFWVRATYFAVLVSHTLLAVVVAPLALFTAWQGYRGQLVRHVRVARWTVPLWLYVSITGVVVYWMLYRLYPPGG
jgi:uncharacterized membrane protein YozB (DUF420 family)